MKSFGRENSNTIHGEIYPNADGSNVFDGDFLTFFHSDEEIHYYKPYLLIDFKKSYTIAGVIAIRRKGVTGK